MSLILKDLVISSFVILPCTYFINNNNNNNNNNNSNNTYIAPISILLFSSTLKNKNIFFKKILTLHKIYMEKVHEPTKKSKTIMSS